MLLERRQRVFTFASVASLTAIVLLTAALQYAEHYPPHNPALAPQGVPNFGQVNPLLFRGGQPSEEGFAALKKLGIEIVVNLREERVGIASERREVEGLGMRYVSIPWSSWHRPGDTQVAAFLDLLRVNPQKKIFVHCHHGADRTGVMVAAYRIATEHWTPQQAIAEMDSYYFHSLWMHHLKTYVQNFPQLLETDPTLRALRTAAQSSTP